MAKKESEFQANLIKDLKARFKDCVVMKLDSSYIQGIPDLLVLYKDKWAVLECKRHARASHQPNQDYYVDKLNSMSFASFVYPENKEDVLYALSKAFKLGGTSRGV